VRVRRRLLPQLVHLHSAHVGREELCKLPVSALELAADSSQPYSPSRPSPCPVVQRDVGGA
jgi:hypothetical protein